MFVIAPCDQMSTKQSPLLVNSQKLQVCHMLYLRVSVIGLLSINMFWIINNFAFTYGSMWGGGHQQL